MNKKIKIGFVNNYLKGRDVDCKKGLYPDASLTLRIHPL